jgi:acyl-homoserine lactone acylase PvdQ
MKNIIAVYKILLSIYCLFFLTSSGFSQNYTPTEIARWKEQAKNTTIIRDEWGIPHIYGKTDANAVFGLMYAQCEENFSQIEKNFLEMLGRRSELEGASLMYDDLMMKLIQDSTAAIKDFEQSPLWFKKLLIAHADGINYYLYKHPSIQPAVIKYFKPWYHLMWTDGSVSPTRSGGINAKDVAQFYGNDKNSIVNNSNNKLDFYDMEERTLKGSNGFAIAPKHSKNGTALLYINPHVPFYFRSEMHMVSEEGLNAYGAVTWGQMFIYQGFNEHCGWMHTSSYADVADVYEEKISKKGNQYVYEYEKKLSPVKLKQIPIAYKEGALVKTKLFTTYYTLHGPVMGIKNDKWISLQENNRSLNALLECWTRTKATNLKEYQKALSLLANNSNNTVYADAAGNIAYWHGNFMPKRDPRYNYTLPVDGSIKATNWQGIHPLTEIVQSINPVNGWLQNCNATPYTVAGVNSPDPKNYPAYMAPDGQNGRGINAQSLLEKIDKIDLEELIQIGYNKHLSAFDILLPSFLDYTKTVSLTSQQQKAINYLSNWNHDAAQNSIATTLAIEWATKWALEIPAATTEEGGTQIIVKYNRMVKEVSNEKKLALLDSTLQQLTELYGSWEQQWGAINRYQRVNPGEKFNDQQSSIAVAQTSSKWGQLPAFESKRFEGSKNRYGYSGNSFVAAVSFGKKLIAKTVITGGQSRFANEAHFTDQAKRYIEGDFKTIHYYKQDVLAHKVTSYNPGLDK